MKAPIRILAIVPQPSDAAWSAAAAAAWASIEASLRTATSAGSIELVRLKPATSNALEERLAREPFDVVHVVARGTSRPAARHGTLTLEGSDGKSRDVNAQNFAKLCARISDLELVVLQNAGGSPAELDVLRDTILQHAASVACAPAGSSPDDACGAVEFARILYSSLASGKSLEQAFASATQNPTGLPRAGSSRTPGEPLLLLRTKRAEPPPVVRPRSESTRDFAITDRGNAAEGSVAQPPQERIISAAERQIERKRAAGAFDVFLCHNVGDKPAVMEIGRRLMASGILPWLDLWELRPGMPWQRLLEEQIANIHAAAVFVGREGIGPWQRHELDGFLREFNKRGCPVIPVMLPGAGGEPELPLFLRGMTWVDFRVTDPDPLAQLIWGITGQRPV